MRIALLFMFISTLMQSQHSLIKINGDNSIEFGGQYTTASTGQAGLWGAYNGIFRAELFADKYTSSFSQGTHFGARITFPLLKQSDSFPINILGDTKITRNQNSGFSNTSYYGAGLISHQIKKGNTIISPLASIGYVRFSSGGDMKWTLGVDAQIKKIVLGIEYGNTGGFGTTYFNIGYKFGLGQSAAAKLAEQQAEQQRLEEEQAEQLEQQQAEQQKLDQQRAEQLKLEQQQAEQQRLEQQRAEQQRLEQQQADQLKLEQQQAEQQRLERQQAEQLRMEQELLKSQQEGTSEMLEGNFSVQFFASIYSYKVFDDLYHFGKIFIEEIPNRKLYRYKIGYFNTRAEAENVIIQIKQLGYNDAFIRQNQ